MEKLLFLSALCVGFSLVAADSCFYTRAYRSSKSCGRYGWSRCVVYRTGNYTDPCSWGTTYGWTNVGGCSRNCGGGQQEQRGTQKCTGTYCSKTITQSRNITCNRHDCPVNGGWTVWSIWETQDGSQCSVTCGDGTFTEVKRRTCTNPAPDHGGAVCSGNSTETRPAPCNLRECPVNGGWTAWGNWETQDGSQCSVTCGNGTFTEEKRRTCTNPAPDHGGAVCSGNSTATRPTPCNQRACPVNGGWTVWGNWETQDGSKCSVTCGDGTFTEEKRRTCTNPAPDHGGAVCSGNSTATRPTPCNMRECPVDGGWSDWTAWTYEGECPVECGGYPVTESRSRACDSPPRAHGGLDCEGNPTETQEGECNSEPCPVNGGWTDWTNWETQEGSQCSVTCGDGTFTEVKRRTCTNPAPDHGGAVCSGNSTETRQTPCNLRQCPVDGGWSDWSEWESGDYTVTGTSASRPQTRYRTCSNPEPQFGGAMCQGGPEQTRDHVCQITTCEDLCSKPQPYYANPGRRDTYYTCSDGNKDGMVVAACDNNMYFDGKPCSPICGRTDRGVVEKRTRCGNDVYCIFGMTFPMTCKPNDNECWQCLKAS